MKRGRRALPKSRQHNELHSAAQHARRRRWLRILLVSAGIILAGYASLVGWLLLTNAPARLPDDIVSSGNLAQIRAYLRGDTTRLLLSPTSPTGVRGSSASGAQPTSPVLLEMAERWVALVNQANPDAILKHDVDALGNLYLYPGYWYYQLSTQEQLQAVDQLGRYWRSYLFEVVGDWGGRSSNRSERFAPGVIIMDANSNEVAHSINGHVRVLRHPQL